MKKKPPAPVKLRIVAGKFRGRVIEVPVKDSDFRPTKDMVREALASTLAPFLIGARVLDLCAGSGAVGLELLSRGATMCDFVELDKGRCIALKANLAKSGCDPSSVRILNVTAESFVSHCPEKYDIIFFDPPYHSLPLAHLVQVLPSLLSGAGSILVIEQEIGGACKPDSFQGAFEVKSRIYGRTELIFCTVVPQQN